jgi:hypothetical protein
LPVRNIAEVAVCGNCDCSSEYSIRLRALAIFLSVGSAEEAAALLLAGEGLEVAAER